MSISIQFVEGAVDTVLDYIDGILLDYIIPNVNNEVDLDIYIKGAIDKILDVLGKGVQNFFRRYEIPQDKYVDILEQTMFKEIFTGFFNDILGDIKKVPSYLNVDREFVLSVVHDNTKKLKRELIAEDIVLKNITKAIYYDSLERDDVLYKWSVFYDNRTSIQCKEINQRVPDTGIPLEELKKIIREVAEKYEPKLTFRDFQAHLYCRSALVAVLA